MSGLIILAFLLVLFWFALVRPQRARSRDQRELLTSLDVGDEVVSTGGLYGSIVAIDGDVLQVEIADGLTVRMARAAVAGIVEEIDEEEGDSRYPEEPADE